MKLSQLELFCLVVEKESLSEVARLLYLTQPAVSFQIQSLENNLGITLLLRSTQGVCLTAQGALFYRYAKEIVKLNKQMQLVLEQQAYDKENIVIGVESNAGNYTIPRLLGCFKKQNPNLRISYQLGNSKTVREWLQKDLVDLCIVGNVISEEDRYISNPFLEDELVLVVGITHPLSQKNQFDLDDLTTTPLVLREKGSGTRQLIEERLLSRGVGLRDLEVAMEVPDNEAIKEILQSGMGAAFLSKWAIKKELELGLLHEIPFVDSLFQYQIFMVMRKERKDIATISGLMEFLKKRKVSKYNLTCTG